MCIKKTTKLIQILCKRRARLFPLEKHPIHILEAVNYNFHDSNKDNAGKEILQEALDIIQLYSLYTTREHRFYCFY
jgi:hypothetical protein